MDFRSKKQTSNLLIRQKNILEAKLLLVAFVMLQYWSFWMLHATLLKETPTQVFPVDLRNF